jgi:RND family efflux transporter MFP subunit
MDDRSELLERLRINRGEGPATQTTGRRWPVPVAIGIALLLAGERGSGGAAWFLNAGSDAVPVKTAVATAVQSNSSGPSMGRTLLDASGYVVALRQAQVSSNIIYKVDEILVQAGDVVKQGQVIARLDNSNTRAALEASKAQVKQLEAALAAAKVAAADIHPAFLRNQAQLKEALISQDAFDTAKSNDDAAQQSVLVAEQNLAVARANVIVNQRYEDTTVIRAPFDGVITVKSAQPGQIVSPQFSGGGGIVTIVDMDSLEVDVDVSENFISRVHSKQPAAITLNAYPDWHIPAEVIAIVPTADRSKATVEVRVGFKQRDARPA